MGWRYRPQLDGVRAVAVLAVVGFHYDMSRVRGGYFGVQIFFVLSGYLITGLLLVEREQTSRIDLPAFYTRRILRLYPALLFMVMGALVLAHATGHPQISEPTILLGAGAAMLYLNDFVLAVRQFTGYYDVTWSLGVEEQFYILWPLILRRALRRMSPQSLSRACLGAAVALAIGDAVFRVVLGFHATYYTPLGNALPLVVGCALALNPPQQGSAVTAAAGAGAAALLVLVFAGPSSTSVALWLGPQQLSAVASAAVIAYLIEHEPRALVARPVVWLGRRSYGVYLWHQVVLLALDHELPNASVSEVALIGIPASIAIAGLSYRYVEQPFLRRKSSFGRVRPAPAAAGAGS